MSINPKEEIMRAIKEASLKKTQRPHDNVDPRGQVFKPSEDGMDVQFAENFIANHGTFYFAESTIKAFDEITRLLKTRNWNKVCCQHSGLTQKISELNYRNIQNDPNIKDLDVAITCCEYLIADTGSILLSDRLKSDPVLWYKPKVHIVFAFATQILASYYDALKEMRRFYKKLPDQIHLITGPSKTYAIEGKEQIGAMGTQELYLFLVENKKQ